MGIISFWNNNTGKIGQTYSALAIASYMAIEHNYKILLVSTKHNDTISMQAFGLSNNRRTINLFTRNKGALELESGIESLSKLASANRLTPEVIPNYTKMIFRNRLEILSGPTSEQYEKVYPLCIDMINVAKRHYDIVFVDLNNGVEDETTNKIINMSDILITNIEQKKSELDSLLELKENKILSKNTLILINKYDRDSKYSVKNCTRYLGEKKDILSVPYNVLFAEAIEEGQLAEYFLNPKLRKLQDTEDKNAFFINELKRDSNSIIYKMQELQMRA